MKQIEVHTMQACAGGTNFTSIFSNIIVILLAVVVVVIVVVVIITMKYL